MPVSKLKKPVVENKKTLKPLMGYVLVEPSEADTRTASGLYLPETAQEKPAQGKVMACGTDMVLENGKVVSCPVKVGDLVVYKKWGGDEIKLNGVEYKLVKFDDLMAILE
ncbi:co-chaperone GroES [Candidatus Daviesbacteria bacterium]|nr:co-chaperone GroES [Candidatus Daviesbacteria bacterium]